MYSLSHILELWHLENFGKIAIEKGSSEQIEWCTLINFKQQWQKLPAFEHCIYRHVIHAYMCIYFIVQN